MPRTWTAEQRRAQSKKIRQQKPWTRATGPKTATGKDQSRNNALKADTGTLALRAALAPLKHALLLRQKFLQNLEASGRLADKKIKKGEKTN